MHNFSKSNLLITSHWSFSIRPENINNQMFFEFLSGIERDQQREMG